MKPDTPWRELGALQRVGVVLVAAAVTAVAGLGAALALGGLWRLVRLVWS